MALRIDYDGLIAVAIHDDQLGNATDRVTLIFPDPVAYDLEPHVPRIEIDDANTVDWHATTVAPLPGVDPLSFPLTGWDVTSRIDDHAPSGSVVFPTLQPDPGDPSGFRKFDTPARLLSLTSICHDDQLKDGYFHPPGSAFMPDLMGRFVIESGLFHTKSLNNGRFETWRFVLNEQEVDRQDSAAGFTTIDFPQRSVQFMFTKLTDAKKTATLTLSCPQERNTTIRIKHTCENCQPHRGKHLAVYYAMVKAAQRRPAPEFQFTAASYCPAGRFMRPAAGGKFIGIK